MSKALAVLQDHIFQHCRYRVPNRLPKGIEQRNAVLIESLRTFIDAENAPHLNVVVAVPPGARHWQREMRTVEFYCFGTFRSPFAALTEAATAFGEYYSEFLTFPRILPIVVSSQDLENILRADWFKHMLRTGIIAYGNK